MFVGCVFGRISFECRVHMAQHIEQDDRPVSWRETEYNRSEQFRNMHYIHNEYTIQTHLLKSALSRVFIFEITKPGFIWCACVCAMFAMLHTWTLMIRVWGDDFLCSSVRSSVIVCVCVSDSLLFYFTFSYSLCKYSHLTSLPLTRKSKCKLFPLTRHWTHCPLLSIADTFIRLAVTGGISCIWNRK